MQKFGRQLFVPAIVNFHFSAELYLKYLLHRSGRNLHEKIFQTHDLSKLFDRLELTVQTEIKKLVAYREELFVENMSIHRDVFERWRYIYEDNNGGIVNLQFTKKLIASIKSVI